MRCRRRPGSPPKRSGDVVVKELLDNALDAAETAGRAPIIDIATRTDDRDHVRHRDRQRLPVSRPPPSPICATSPCW